MAMTGEVTDEQLDLIIDAVLLSLNEAGADVSFVGSFYEDNDQNTLKRKIRELLR